MGEGVNKNVASSPTPKEQQVTRVELLQQDDISQDPTLTNSYVQNATELQNAKGGPSFPEVDDSEQQVLEPSLSFQHSLPPLVSTSNGFSVLCSSNNIDSGRNKDPSSIAPGADPIPGNV
ncbi:unnamed protein product [Amaranthus hypochondriacus]